MEDFSGIDFIGVCFWAWSAYFRTGVIVRELHSDRILAGLDRARRQGKTLGRPKKVIDVEKLATMLAAGYSERAIARELGCATSTVCRAPGPGRKKRRLAAIMTTTTLELDRRDRSIVLLAIGIAIEHENRALESCCEQLRGRSAAVGEAIRERQRALKELRRTRQRLLRAETPTET